MLCTQIKIGIVFYIISVFIFIAALRSVGKKIKNKDENTEEQKDILDDVSEIYTELMKSRKTASIPAAVSCTKHNKHMQDTEQDHKITHIVTTENKAYVFYFIQNKQGETCIIAETDDTTVYAQYFGDVSDVNTDTLCLSSIENGAKKTDEYKLLLTETPIKIASNAQCRLFKKPGKITDSYIITLDDINENKSELYTGIAIDLVEYK